VTPGVVGLDDDQQLGLFLDLFDRMHQMSQQQLDDLRHGPSGSDNAVS
jgi:hypothetical protein